MKFGPLDTSCVPAETGTENRAYCAYQTIKASDTLKSKRTMGIEYSKLRSIGFRGAQYQGR